MGTITITDLTGTTNPATVQANDVALVDNGLGDLDNSTNVSQYKSRFVVTDTWGDLAIDNYIAREIGGATDSHGAGTTGSPAYTTKMAYNLCTFQAPFAMHIESVQVIANNIGTNTVGGLNGSNYWTFKVETGTARDTGGTWTTHNTITLNDPTSAWRYASVDTALTINRFFRVKGEITTAGSSLPDCDLQIVATFTKENV